MRSPGPLRSAPRPSPNRIERFAVELQSTPASRSLALSGPQVGQARKPLVIAPGTVCSEKRRRFESAEDGLGREPAATGQPEGERDSPDEQTPGLQCFLFAQEAAQRVH